MSERSHQKPTNIGNVPTSTATTTKTTNGYEKFDLFDQTANNSSIINHNDSILNNDLSFPRIQYSGLKIKPLSVTRSNQTGNNNNGKQKQRRTDKRTASATDNDDLLSALASPARRLPVPTSVNVKGSEAVRKSAKKNEYRYSFLSKEPQRNLQTSDNFVIDDERDEEESTLNVSQHTPNNDKSSQQTILIPLKSTPTGNSKFRRTPTPAKDFLDNNNDINNNNNNNSKKIPKNKTPAQAEAAAALINYDSSIADQSSSSISQLYSSIHKGINNARYLVSELGSRQGTPITSKISSPRVDSFNELQRAVSFTESHNNHDYNEMNKFVKNKLISEKQTPDNYGSVNDNSRPFSRESATKTDFYISTMNSLNKRKLYKSVHDPLSYSQEPTVMNDSLAEEIDGETVLDQSSNGTVSNNSNRNNIFKRQQQHQQHQQHHHNPKNQINNNDELKKIKRKRQFDEVSDSDDLSDAGNVYRYVSQKISRKHKDSRSLISKNRKRNGNNNNNNINDDNEDANVGKNENKKSHFDNDDVGDDSKKTSYEKPNIEMNPIKMIAKPDSTNYQNSENWPRNKWIIFAKLVQEAKKKKDSLIVYDEAVYKMFDIKDKIEMNLRIQLVQHFVLGTQKSTL